jgi:DNA-binding transcriptional MerR regulator
MAVAAPPGLKIGTVAARSGLPVKTIRFYCDEGLIQPVARSAGHYRLFDEEVYAELALIRRLKAMALPLAEVKGILAARRSGLCTCETLQATLREKVDEIEAKIHDLRTLRVELTTLLESWQSCGGRRA